MTLRRWSLSLVWPIKFVAGEWDNESDENVIQQVTLTYDFLRIGAVRPAQPQILPSIRSCSHSLGTAAAKPSPSLMLFSPSASC